MKQKCQEPKSGVGESGSEMARLLPPAGKVTADHKRNISFCTGEKQHIFDAPFFLKTAVICYDSFVIVD